MLLEMVLRRSFYTGEAFRMIPSMVFVKNVTQNGVLADFSPLNKRGKTLLGKVWKGLCINVTQYGAFRSFFCG